MRDHTKLDAFELADELVLLIFEATRSFPKKEDMGLTAQIRQAAVNVPAMIVEACARYTLRQYVSALQIAYTAQKRLEYLLSLARRLEYLPEKEYEPLAEKCERVSKVLGSLVLSLRAKTKKRPGYAREEEDFSEDELS